MGRLLALYHIKHIIYYNISRSYLEAQTGLVESQSWLIDSKLLNPGFSLQKMVIVSIMCGSILFDGLNHVLSVWICQESQCELLHSALMCITFSVTKDQLPTVFTRFTEAGIARSLEKEKPGRLQPIASILMKILAARMARPDLLRATQSLASRVTPERLPEHMPSVALTPARLRQINLLSMTRSSALQLRWPMLFTRSREGILHGFWDMHVKMTLVSSIGERGWPCRLGGKEAM